MSPVFPPNEEGVPRKQIRRDSYKGTLMITLIIEFFLCPDWMPGMVGSEGTILSRARVTSSLLLSHCADTYKVVI